MTVNQLKNNSNYYKHHAALCRGYESRRGNGTVYPYNGMFGKGYILLTPRYDTTQYVNIDYYIHK